MKVGDLVLDTWHDEMAIVIAVYDFGIRLRSLVNGEEYDEWTYEYIEVINEI